MSEKREGEKSSGYRRAFGGKNVSVQEFKSNVVELKDAVFTNNPMVLESYSQHMDHECCESM